MKLRTMIVGLVLTAVPMWAQNTAPQAAKDAAPGTQAAQSAQAAPKPGAKMRAMHEKHMQEMKQSIAKMKTLLEEMKTNAAGMTGKDKAAWDANIQLWQMMIDHMDKMVNQMSSMGGMGMGPGMMHHRGQGGMMNPPQPAPQQ